MRIVIDLQGAQASNRNRGIGRYSMALAQAIVRNRGEHEVILALNNMLPESVDPIRKAFRDSLPPENIRTWGAVPPVSYEQSAGQWRKVAAEQIRSSFLNSLKPDIVLITSLYEGLADNAVATVGTVEDVCPTAVMLYDLIPHIMDEHYLADPLMEAWYREKFAYMGRADLLLAISESSRMEGIEYLDFAEDAVVTIGTAADDNFTQTNISSDREEEIRQRYGLTRPYVMYTGGADYRKNIEGMIRGYALLPEGLRGNHQLAIVCYVPEVAKNNLMQLARDVGLKSDEMVLTGYVSEDDLVALYNMSRAFVFPSFHEGFGLPVLEAMHCGVPTLAANATSLPEVLGCEEALFDPYDDKDIAAHMERVLTDVKFRDALVVHCLKHAKTFSWDASAKIALRAFEHLQAEHREITFPCNISEKKKKLAYVSPVPPDKSGIADYSFELLPELAATYDIEIILPNVDDTYAQMAQNWILRDLEYFHENNLSYDRVLYHMGNSTFHQHMLDAIKWAPGIVVLHDFFISSLVSYLECCGTCENLWAQSLYISHGYGALSEYVGENDKEEVVWKYPCNSSIVRNSLGMIVHSEFSRSLAAKWISPELADDWKILPLLRAPALVLDREKSLQALGFSADTLLVCSFGILSPNKRNLDLLQAWAASTMKGDMRCQLVFVGKINTVDYGDELRAVIKTHDLADQVHITGWADLDTYRHYLAAADVGVQLRAMTRGETSAAVLDCMNHGMATIINAHGAMADISSDVVWKISDDFDRAELVEALETLCNDVGFRNALGSKGRDFVHAQHAPQICAQQYVHAIEGFYSKAQYASAGQVRTLMNIPEVAGDDAIQRQLAQKLADNHPVLGRQLLVDVSELVQRDAGSGIQRVVKSILGQLFKNPPSGWRIEPVYATVTSRGYRYARRFAMGFIGGNPDCLVDDPIEVGPGDVFLGLDLQPQVVPAQKQWLEKYRSQGLEIHFVVYDLLSVLLPDCFAPGAAEGFTRWLETIVGFDGAMCISQAVAGELEQWVGRNAPDVLDDFRIGWFHLGADVKNSKPSKGVPAGARKTLDAIRSTPSFLMVGTLEPRKGHEQVLSAFEALWARGQKCNLVIVGKQGWLVEELVASLRNHSEMGKHLFWLEGISDEYLGMLYEACSCLIAASRGEGFGLPLIEAAHHGIPVLARDIPVFREVAGSCATFFNADSAQELSEAIVGWLADKNKGNCVKSKGMGHCTWAQSSLQLLEGLVRDQHRLHTNESIGHGTFPYGHGHAGGA